ncbi:MAG: hypothetical protein JJE19_04300 [Methanosarcinales archaeon]|nr:hypothetical protein [Methanosarcinales archaeon]
MFDFEPFEIGVIPPHLPLRNELVAPEGPREALRSFEKLRDECVSGYKTEDGKRSSPIG